MKGNFIIIFCKRNVQQYGTTSDKRDDSNTIYCNLKNISTWVSLGKRVSIRWHTTGTYTYVHTGGQMRDGSHCTFRTRGKINLIVSEIEFTRAVRLSCSSSGTTKSLTMLSRCPNRGDDTRVPGHRRKCTHRATLSRPRDLRASHPNVFEPACTGKLSQTHAAYTVYKIHSTRPCTVNDHVSLS